MKKRLTPLTILSVFLCLSCYYDPAGEFYKPVDEPSTDGRTVFLTSSSDTIYLFTRTAFDFSYAYPKGHLISITGSLNGKRVFQSTGVNNKFTLDPAQLEQGTHTLNVEMLTTSGTGSIADALGTEVVTIEKKWTVIVDTSAPHSIDISRIYPEAGTLFIEWKKYTHWNFQGYYIKKYCEVSGNFYPCASYTISDQELTKMADTTFLAGRVRYEIKVKASDQFSDETTADFQFHFDPGFKWHATDDGRVVFTWRKTPFYNNLARHEVTQPNGSFVFRSAAVDTTCATNAREEFSTVLQYAIRYDSKGTDKLADVTGKTTYYTGEQFFRFRDVHYHRATDRYYISPFRGDSVLQVNAATLEVENRLARKFNFFALSEDGNILYTAQESIVERRDPETFEVMSTFDVRTLDREAYVYPFGKKFMVTNNNTLVIPTFYRTYVMDMETSTVLFKKLSAEESRDNLLAIRPDGQQFYFRNTAYQRSGSTYVATDVTLASDPRTIDYINADSAYAVSGNRVLIFNPANGMEISSYEAPLTISSSGYDPASGRFYAVDYYSDSRMLVYDLRQRIQTMHTLSNTKSYVYKIVNNKIVCSSGYLKDVGSF